MILVLSICELILLISGSLRSRCCELLRSQLLATAEAPPHIVVRAKQLALYCTFLARKSSELLLLSSQSFRRVAFSVVAMVSRIAAFASACTPFT